VLATLLLGVWPGRVLDYAGDSARQLVSRSANPTTPHSLVAGP
jgi:hypothetical protein